jgi:hypothetical protein
MKIPELSWPTEPSAYDEDLLLSVTPGTVTLLVRGRNAWNSTWVRHYLRNATLYTDTQSAKYGAESQRGPGNVFYVIDAPALLLTGMQSNVVLCDAHPDNPFGNFTGLRSSVVESMHGAWVNGLFPGISVRDAVAAFRHTSGHWSGSTPSEHSLRTGRLESSDQFLMKRVEMQSLVSRPVGSKYYLQWDNHEKGNRYTRRGTNAVSKGWNEALAEALDGSVLSPTGIGPLRRHRDEVLRALPKSVWLEKRSRDQAEERARKQSAYEAWDAATDRVAELEDAIWDAEVEREAAQAARLKPADTSAGIRAQRERYEAAVAEETRLQEEHARAEAEADKLWLAYTQA